MDEFDEDGDELGGGIFTGDQVLVETEDKLIAGVLLQTGMMGVVVRVTHRLGLRVDEVSLEDEEVIRAALEELRWVDLLEYAVKMQDVKPWHMIGMRSKSDLVEECVERAIEKRVRASERATLRPVLVPTSTFIPSERVIEITHFGEWQDDNMLQVLDWAAELPKDEAK